jgi:hypothetical protein
VLAQALEQPPRIVVAQRRAQPPFVRHGGILGRDGDVRGHLRDERVGDFLQLLLEVLVE